MSERKKQQIRVAADVLIKALTHPTLSENEVAQEMVAHTNFQPDELHHPSPDRLQAYTLGKCRAQEMAAIYQHLTDCPSCLTRLDNLPGVDSFVLWLRMLMRFQGKERT